MPVKDKYAYPKNWREIALREKNRAHWMCEECGADCLFPTSHANVLTVHHKDHDPANCDENNLIALCSVCHLRADANWHARNAAITRASKRAGATLALPMRT